MAALPLQFPSVAANTRRAAPLVEPEVAPPRRKRPPVQHFFRPSE